MVNSSHISGASKFIRGEETYYAFGYGWNMENSSMNVETLNSGWSHPTGRNFSTEVQHWRRGWIQDMLSVFYVGGVVKYMCQFTYCHYGIGLRKSPRWRECERLKLWPVSEKAARTQIFLILGDRIQQGNSTVFSFWAKPLILCSSTVRTLLCQDNIKNPPLLNFRLYPGFMTTFYGRYSWKIRSLIMTNGWRLPGILLRFVNVGAESFYDPLRYGED